MAAAMLRLYPMFRRDVSLVHTEIRSRMWYSEFLGCVHGHFP